MAALQQTGDPPRMFINGGCGCTVSCCWCEGYGTSSPTFVVMGAAACSFMHTALEPKPKDAGKPFYQRINRRSWEPRL